MHFIALCRSALALLPCHTSMVRFAKTRGRIPIKTLLVMKLTFYLLTAVALHAHAEGFSQKMSFSGRNVPITTLFNTIEKNCGYVILYDRALLKNAGTVTLHLRNASVETILSEAFRKKPVDFSIKNKTIFIYGQEEKVSPLEPLTTIQDTIITLSGRVLDSTTNVPLEGVSVTLAGTNIGTATGPDGRFQISTRDQRSYILQFSFVGYEMKRITHSGERSINVSLSMSSDDMGQVVVIGYGTVQKKDLTGSVSSISPAEADRGVNVSVDQMMQGRAPGVRIVQSSGEPGSGVSVRIRGANSITAGNEPLYVIDGLPINNEPGPGSSVQRNQIPRNPLNALNPGDIESIDILKDASAAAIYGSRGANGVILITTKKGKKGGLRFNYNAYTGVQQVAKKLDLMDAQQYMNYLNTLNEDMGQSPLFTEQEMSAIGKGTDWQEEIFRSAPIQNHQVSFSGGAENTQYYISLNYLDQQGVVISSGAKRLTSRVNVTHTTKRFSLGLNMNTSFLKDDFVPNGVGENNVAGALATAIQMDPTMPVRNSEGIYSISSVVDIDNPVALANTMYDEAETNRTFGTIFAEYKLTDHLKARINLGSDRQSSRRDSYITKDTRRGLNLNSRADANHHDRVNYLGEFLLSYDRSIGGNRLNAVAGYTHQHFAGRNFSAGGQDYFTDAYLTDNLGAGSPELNVISSGRYQNQLISYLARINYTIKDRYLLTASFRADGSSRFGEGNKFGYFPSLAAAWKISEEEFMASSNIFSDLKLRGSFGVTGNQEIGNYQSLVLLGLAGSAIFNEARYVGISSSRLGNRGLKWETTRQINAGVDFGILGNRITGSVDYFVKNTFDLLLDMPIPLTSGFATSLQNVGDTRNSGFEFAVHSRNTTGQLKWSTSFNLATIRNRVIGLGDLEDIKEGSLRFLNQFTILREGEAMNSYYGYQVEGIFQDAAEIAESAQPAASPGDLKIRDINNSGTITADDRVIMGNPFPEFYFGLNNDFSWKGIELNIFIEGVQGQELLNFTRVDSEFPIEFRRNRLTYVADRWTPQNTSSPNPSFINYLHPVNSRLVEDASFIRLKNVRLSYHFPKLRSKSVSSLSIFVTGQNLLTLTDYSGFDPDVNAFSGTNNIVDYNAYPLARIYTLGINVGL